MVSFRNSLVIVPIVFGALILNGCVGKPVAPPAPAPVVRPAPVAPAPLVANWEDGVLTPGSWSYTRDARGGLALYGIGGSNAALSIRCDTATRRIFVSRPGGVAGSMTLRATTGARVYAAKPTAGPIPYVAAEISPIDPQLDAMAFSRGRFLVGLSGAVDVVVPSWPEVARVIEDCRG
jgi:hypothetical protein